MRSERSWLLIVLAGGLLAYGCGGTIPGANPDDMSAVAHRAEGAKHAAKAKAHAEKFDPSAARTRPPSRSGDYDETTYNPTEHHRAKAERHERHARAHEAAAKELERYEEAECKGVPSATRSQCPLMGHLSAGEPIEGGIRVRFAEGTDVEATTNHVRCHLAYARTQGREGMDWCPLYLKGVRIERRPDGVDLISDDAAVVQQLRERITKTMK